MFLFDAVVLTNPVTGFSLLIVHYYLLVTISGMSTDTRIKPALIVGITIHVVTQTLPSVYTSSTWGKSYRVFSFT